MTFTESKWEEMVDKITGTFRLGVAESESLKQNPVAKLIGAIPVIAECENSERTALAHLGTYMLAKDPACKSDFGHTAEDDEDFLKRIQLMNHFQGGDRSIIEKGMNLLALIQLEDHRHDAAEDEAAGKYNPVSAGKWDYENTRDRLISRIRGVESRELDEVMTAETVPAYWDEAKS